MDADPDANQIFTQILILLLLTLVNSFFAGAEMAVVSVNKNKIKLLAEEGNKKALLIQTLFEDSTKFLSTIQVAITFAGFFSSATAATGISQSLGTWLEKNHIPYGTQLSLVIVTIILSYFTLVFGELIPKRIALQKAEVFSLNSVSVIYFVSKVTSPFIKLLSASTNGFLRLIGMKTDNLEETISEEEIKALLETGREKGVFNEIEKEMIDSIFSFDDKIAKDVMIPRKEVLAIDIDEPLSEYIDEMLESRFTRIPVYSGDIDNIIGILHILDYVLEARKKSFENVDISTILRKPYFVPESKNTDVLFRELQKTQNHMALLIDEYGGFSGIVTIEDLVEEIMGDINDEFDLDEPEIVSLENNTYLIDGRLLVEDLNNTFHLDIQVSNYDSISGFLIEYLGYIPEEDDRSVIQIDNVEFTLHSIKEKRIEKVLLKIHKSFEDTEEKDSEPQN